VIPEFLESVHTSRLQGTDRAGRGDLADNALLQES
jgi:hypothetical protein